MPALLEVGPTTITDEKPHLVDPVVWQLGQILEANAPLMNAGMELELEVRLGILKGWKAGRANLPCSTEALLVPQCENFSYKFQPGLPPEIFVELMNKLEKLELPCSAADEEVLDIVYDVPHQQPNMPPRHIRVSHTLCEDAESGQRRWGNPVAMVKSRREALDLFAGRSVPTNGPTFDLRVALSTEAKLRGTTLPSPSSHQVSIKREKRRRTLDFKAWKVDFTRVRSEADGNTVLSYEVELELKSALLRKNLEAKRNGDDTHKLWELLTDFLDASRDLAALASETWPLKKPPPLKPEPEGKSAEEKEAYKKRLPERPEPLIGHYLYRLSSAGWPNKQQKIDDAA